VVCVLRCDADAEGEGRRSGRPGSPPRPLLRRGAKCCSPTATAGPTASSRPRSSDGPSTGPLSLRRELDGVRVDGYAVETSAAVADMRSVAAPIVEAGETVAALQICAVEVGEDVARRVARTAQQLSDNLADERS
jgi:DNA-binding IclR family transcriptional regulator